MVAYMNTIKTAKGTTLPIMDIRGKPYLQVAHRIVWFREEHPDWSIETSIKVDGNSALGHAIISDPTGRTIATAHKSETIKGFADFIEKAETGAIGRALALCGYGTQFAPELEEKERLVDSPIIPKKAASLSRPEIEDDFPDFGFEPPPLADLSIKLNKLTAEQPKPTTQKVKEKPATDAQLRRLFKLASEFKWPEDSLKKYAQVKYGIASRKELTLKQCSSFMDYIEGGGRP